MESKLTGDFWDRIADNIDAALFIQNRNGDGIYANKKTLNWFGLSPYDYSSLNSYKLYSSGIIRTHLLAECLNTGSTVNAVQVMKLSDQTYSRPYFATQTPIFDDKGEFVYSVQLTHNMDALNQRFQTAIEEANEKKLYKLNLQKEMVVAGETLSEIIKDAYNIADCDATVLISGESGTGKECLAKYIHENSRATKEFVAINCAALPESLLESELFGFEKGSFSGAISEKPGLFEFAHGGTLLLDEIDALPLPLQGKLLRVIETKQVRRLGSIYSKHVDFRLIAATNIDIEEAVMNRAFRLDLFHRLNVVPLYMPPLRQRVDEIRPLCEHFLKLNCDKYHRVKRLSEKAIHQLECYDWPGNIRELRNFIERIVLMTDSRINDIYEISESEFKSKTKYFPMLSVMQDKETLSDSDSYFQHPFGFNPEITFKDHVRKYERWLVNQVVKHFGSFEKAARSMSIDKSTLIRKRKDE